MTTADGAGPVLATELAVPPVPARLVDRPRLIRLLDAARDLPVTAVTAAPASVWSPALPGDGAGWLPTLVWSALLVGVTAVLARQLDGHPRER